MIELTEAMRAGTRKLYVNADHIVRITEDRQSKHTDATVNAVVFTTDKKIIYVVETVEEVFKLVMS